MCCITGCASFSMYWAIKAKKMNIWLSYGKFLPENLSDLTFYLGIVLGCLLTFLFFIGILLVTRIKHCIISCPVIIIICQGAHDLIQFGVCTFIIFIVYYMLGILSLAAGFYGKEAFTDYCNNRDLDYWSGFALFDYVKEIDNTYLELNKQLMCTDICPCSKYNERAYQGYNFTAKNFSGSNKNVIKCIEGNQYSDKWDYDVLNYLQELEKNYKCSGLCSAQTFLMFTDFTEIPNKASCYSSIGGELERDMGNMGYVFLSCGTFVFCAWFCAFGLCFRDKQAKELREHIRAKKYIMEGTMDNSEIGGLQSHQDGVNDVTKGGGDDENLVQNQTIDQSLNNVIHSKADKKSNRKTQRQKAFNNNNNNPVYTKKNQYNNENSGNQNSSQYPKQFKPYGQNQQYKQNPNYQKNNSSQSYFDGDSTSPSYGFKENESGSQQGNFNNTGGFKNNYQKNNQYQSNYQEGNANSYQQKNQYSYQQNNDQVQYQRAPSRKPRGGQFKMFFPKPFTISRTNMILSVEVKPAVFELKQIRASSQNQSYISPKNGYICFHFSHIDDQEHVQNETRKTFVMTMGQVRQILDIDPDSKYKKGYVTDATDIESEEKDGEEVFFSFQKQNSQNILNMKVKEMESNRQYQFTYFEVVNNSDIQHTMSIDITAGELKVIQILVRYAMPSLLGWNGALDPKVCGLFFKNTQLDY
ncbi:tetraspanin family protein [Stylonychia lemnae]|uniref:Tetraspanin family protein n=1 Tax=Stylonychia lemnae TaxID=5949 RepID=A0A078A7G4_STYLE|nr:tetraspanin family protein [Stylonychia lemnae]|eukprot:CDW78190.1 tetraspanin family protein [Stylonychia lemnae]